MPKAISADIVKRGIRLCLQTLFVLLMFCLLWPARVTRANTFTVTSTADSGANTLRDAMESAYSNPDADTILFNLGAGVQTITLLSALPTLTGQVGINALSSGSCT